MKKSTYLFVIFVLNVYALQAQFQANVLPINLVCELRSEPMGIDVSDPAFNYMLEAMDKNQRAIRQTAYQIWVSSTPDFKNGGNMWNSQKVIGSQMSYIKYQGKPLQSTKKYWWKIMAWDQNNKPSNWSKTASFTMGILQPADWKAVWISAAGAEKYAHNYASAHTDFNLKRDIAEMRANMPKPTDANYSSMLLRKEFSFTQKPKRATVYVSGLGHYELSINGTKIGDQLLAPGWSDYKKTVLYDTYDVTSQVKKGNNAIGLILGNGMYNIQPDSIRYVKFLNTYGPLKAIAQLVIEYEDGSIKSIGTDDTWQIAPGPITYSNEFGGEDFDANLVQAGWDSPAFKVTKNWTNATPCNGPGGVLKGLSCSAPPIKAIEKLTPIHITKQGANTFVYDFGQNASMMPSLQITGPKGAFIRMIPSELLGANALVDRSSATQDGVRPAWWQYTLQGKGSENYIPKFFYQGARYLQVELYPANENGELPKIEALNDLVVHSSSNPVGSFECSNPLFNKIYKLVRWAQRSNMMSFMTDCPHREKMGWLEENHLNGPALRYNFDMAPLFRKSMNDMADAQLENGFVPNIAPEYFTAGPMDLTNSCRNSAEWGSSFIIVPWQQYLFSGDISLLERYYDRMKKYVGFLSTQAKNNIIYTGLGDWYDIGPKPSWGSQLTPPPFTATAVFYYDNIIMQHIAQQLGKEKDAGNYKAASEQIRKSFNDKFYKAETGLYATGSQTTAAIPLFFNLVEPQNRQRLLDSLVKDIRWRDNSFTSGEVGYRFLLRALADGNRSDVLYDMNNQSEKPGYGYQLKKGATSLTEKWDASVGNFGSQNHFMSGQINEWFFNGLIGIGPDETAPGFKKFIVKPAFLKGLDWVKGSYASVSGAIKVDWKKDENGIKLNIEVPVNTTATIYLPVKNQSEITESGKQVGKSVGVKFIEMKSNNLVYEVQSGNYQFSIKVNKM